MLTSESLKRDSQISGLDARVIIVELHHERENVPITRRIVVSTNILVQKEDLTFFRNQRTSLDELRTKIAEMVQKLQQDTNIKVCVSLSCVDATLAFISESHHVDTLG